MRLGFLVAVLSCAVALDVRTIILNAPTFGLDFRIFGRSATWPLAELYHDSGPIPFIHPPTAILLFWPASLLPSALIVWTIGSALAFAITVAAAVGKRAAILSFMSQAAVKGLVYGQVTMLLAAGVFAGLRLAPFAGGALWGAVATIKPQLMLFAPLVLIVRRDWKMLCGMVAGAAAMFLASVIAFGPALWLEWSAAMTVYTETRALSGATIKAITPAGIAVLAGYSPVPFLMAGALLGAAAVMAAARHVEDEMLVGLIISASLVASPYAHIHDAIALIPACAALALRGRWVLALPAAMIFLGTPLLTMAGLMAWLAIVAMDSIKSESAARPSPAPRSSA